MKTITLHPISVLVGAALVGLSLVLSGGAQTPTVTHHPRVEVVGQIPAAWWTYVKVTNNGTPTDTYTVPLDRHFVVTWVNDTAGGVFVNGQPIDLEPVAYFYSRDRNGTRAVFQPGTFLTAQGVVNLWGYLEPVR